MIWVQQRDNRGRSASPSSRPAWTQRLPPTKPTGSSMLPSPSPPPEPAHLCSPACRRPPDRTVSGHQPHSRYTVERRAALVFDVRAVRRFWLADHRVAAANDRHLRRHHGHPHTTGCMTGGVACRRAKVGSNVDVTRAWYGGCAPARRALLGVLLGCRSEGAGQAGQAILTARSDTVRFRRMLLFVGMYWPTSTHHRNSRAVGSTSAISFTSCRA